MTTSQLTVLKLSATTDADGDPCCFVLLSDGSMLMGQWSVDKSGFAWNKLPLAPGTEPVVDAPACEPDDPEAVHYTPFISAVHIPSKIVRTSWDYDRDVTCQHCIALSAVNAK